MSRSIPTDATALMSAETFASRRDCLHARLERLIAAARTTVTSAGWSNGLSRIGTNC